MSPVSNSTSLLPARRAFVVQLRADARMEAGYMAGRVEHVVSREATTFDSLETLMAFMQRMAGSVEPLDGDVDPVRPSE